MGYVSEIACRYLLLQAIGSERSVQKAFVLGIRIENCLSIPIASTNRFRDICVISCIELGLIMMKYLSILSASANRFRAPYNRFFVVFGIGIMSVSNYSTIFLARDIDRPDCKCVCLGKK